VFEPDKEIITYTDHKELFDKIDYYVNDGVYELRMIAEAGYNRCRREHDIIHRVGRLLSFSESVKEGE
jgi:spore maturation protein CgeB